MSHAVLVAPEDEEGEEDAEMVAVSGSSNGNSNSNSNSSSMSSTPKQQLRRRVEKDDLVRRARKTINAGKKSRRYFIYCTYVRTDDNSLVGL